MSFSPQTIADYYDQTQIHYRYFWQLDRFQTLHYGLWLPGTTDLGSALLHTNQHLADLAKLQAGEIVLDAGCGLGGPALWLAQNHQAQVTGLTLSQRQAQQATRRAAELKLEHLCQFVQADYRSCPVPDHSQDLVWAIEAHASEVDKQAFVDEAARVLNEPHGRLVMADYFLCEKEFKSPEQELMKEWLNQWAISGLCRRSTYQAWLQAAGFTRMEWVDVSPLIFPSARRLYWASQWGRLGTWAYNLYRRASPFSRTHYRAGLAQYRALRQGLWKYYLLAAWRN
ncbi:MAG: methyltransferase domain-containing protein [Bacteroidota bacterium]